ncbi:MAG: SAM-dependent methyltransferase [Proteobacteria bacterium]|nr:SAM-dependent methyltransferase [Pseudomonadota bacterium]MBU1452518.1 SAM-dependent methyltransferase [Pseudomonadota bacterium]MBU2469326.1 SAM-dependent methyltransferase [Pseudomonadota bacterium]MBU2518622.1 SAM-dependent methyltransferase [Pseudomonadota bacterium]
MSENSKSILHPPGQHLVLVDEKDRQHLIQVPEPERVVRLKSEVLDHATLAALHDGELLITPQRRRYLVFVPTLEQVVMNMPREAQVIYPKDLGLLLFYGDVAPGANVMEVGVGHGALTMALLRALGPTGRLTSYDLRRDHLNRTKKNVAAYLGPEFLERWEPVLADPVAEGFGGRVCDRLFSDIPEPWDLITPAAEALSPGGIWVAYVPTVLQLMRQMEALQGERLFCMPTAFEALQRYWHVLLPSLRPKHAMRGHTGFIVTGRRRWLPPAD